MASRCEFPVDPWRWGRGQAGTGSAVEGPGHCDCQGPLKVPGRDSGESWIIHHCIREPGSGGPPNRPGEPTFDLPRGIAKSLNGRPSLLLLYLVHFSSSLVLEEPEDVVGGGSLEDQP